MVETILNLLVQGVLIGGLYALFALGLSLSLGVMRFVNIAHGDMIVLFSFVILSLTGALGWSPFLAALILIPVAFGAGYVLQRFLLQRTVGKGILPILLVTFGLSIIIQNGLLEAYGPNTRKLSGGAVELAAFQVGPIAIGLYPLLVFLLAVALIAGLDAFLYRTSIGRAHPRGQRRSRSRRPDRPDVGADLPDRHGRGRGHHADRRRLHVGLDQFRSGDRAEPAARRLRGGGARRASAASGARWRAA